MKTKTTYSLLIITLLVPVLNAQALELTASTSANIGGARMEARQEMRTEIKEDRMELRADVKAKMGELKASIKEARTKKLDENAKVRVETRLNKIYTHLMGRVERLTKVDAEISKRLENRTNTAIALSLQASARTALAKAKLDVEATKAASSAELTATTSKDVLRGLVKTAEGSIKVAADSYKKVVDAMKDLPRVQVTASSTINN